jgi:hypothetical protein
MITCMCWGGGGGVEPELLMMWPKTSSSGTMKGAFAEVDGEAIGDQHSEDLVQMLR